MNFLDRRVAIAGIPSSRNEDWQPLISYRNSLLHGESDHGAAAATAVPIVPSKRAYTRKRNKDYNEDDDEDNDDSDADPDFRG